MDARLLRAFNATRSRPVAARVLKAETLWDRMRGLLGRDALAEDEGLWIVPCPQIHTFFMRFPIDVLFLDRGLKVVRVMEDLVPWRLSPWVLSAHSVLELKGGVLRGSVSDGDLLELRG
ncbi:MAG: DUF192 domain-containing protein [Elusimicrobia bacterium]|nr:DUF192 domain-containing protein [Elusimicrobiota bacterium]